MVLVTGGAGSPAGPESPRRTRSLLPTWICCGINRCWKHTAGRTVTPVGSKVIPVLLRLLTGHTWQSAHGYIRHRVKAWSWDLFRCLLRLLPIMDSSLSKGQECWGAPGQVFCYLHGVFGQPCVLATSEIQKICLSKGKCFLWWEMPLKTRFLMRNPGGIGISLRSV